MADTSNLSKFLGDVAEAIRTKKETTDKIPAEQFDQEILSIETGIDTSDATATQDDIALNKTAYVNGEKVIGTVFPVSGDWQNDADTITKPFDKLRVKTTMPIDYLFRKGTGVELEATNEAIAEVEGITADKIIKGNIIFGVEGTAESGSSDIPIKVFATEEELMLDEPEIGDLALVLDCSKTNNYVKPYTGMPFTTVHFPQTITFDKVPDANYTQAYVMDPNYTGSTYLVISYNSTTLSFRCEVEGTSTNHTYTSSDGLIYTRDAEYEDFTFPEYMNFTDDYDLQACAVVNGYNFGGLFEYKHFASSTVRMYNKDVVTITEAMDDWGMGTTYEIEVNGFKRFDTSLWKDIVLKGKEKLKSMFPDYGYDDFTVCIEGVETSDDYITKIKLYWYPVSNYSSDSMYIYYNSEESSYSFTNSATGTEFMTVYTVECDVFGNIGEVIALDFTSDTGINIPINNNYFGIAHVYDEWMYNTDFQAKNITPKEGLQISYPDLFYIYDTGYKPLVTNLNLTAPNQLKPGVTGYGNGIVTGDGSIYDVPYTDFQKDYLKTPNYGTYPYIKLPICTNENGLTNYPNVFPIKRANTGPICIPTNYHASHMFNNGSIQLTRLNNKLYGWQRANIQSIFNIYYSSLQMTTSGGSAITTATQYNIYNINEDGTTGDVIDTYKGYCVETKYGLLYMASNNTSTLETTPTFKLFNGITTYTLNIPCNLVTGYKYIYSFLFAEPYSDYAYFVISNTDSSTTKTSRIIVLDLHDGLSIRNQHDISATVDYASAYAKPQLYMPIDVDGKMIDDKVLIPMTHYYNSNYNMVMVEYDTINNTFDTLGTGISSFISNGMTSGVYRSIDDDYWFSGAYSDNLISNDFSTRVSLTTKGISSSNYKKFYRGGLYIMITRDDVSIYKRATAAVDKDTATVTYSVIDENTNDYIPNYDAKYSKTIVLESSYSQIQPWAYVSNIIYNENTDTVKTDMKNSYIVPLSDDGVIFNYFTGCEWTDTDLCGIAMKTSLYNTSDWVSVSMLNLNEKANDILNQYYYNIGITDVYNDTITPQEYNQALDTASEILGDEEE